MAAAISIPTAPVVPAIRHIFFASGSMGGVRVSRRALEIKADRAIRAIGAWPWGASWNGEHAVGPHAVSMFVGLVRTEALKSIP
jgi:hypothetical protein